MNGALMQTMKQAKSTPNAAARSCPTIGFLMGVRVTSAFLVPQGARPLPMRVKEQ